MCIEDIVIGRAMYNKRTAITNASTSSIGANILRYGLYIFVPDSGAAAVVTQNGNEWARVYGPQLGSGAMGPVNQLFKASDYGQLVTGENTFQLTTAGTGYAIELLLPDNIGQMIQEYAKKLPKPVY